MTGEYAVEADGVEKRFGDDPVVDGVDLRLPAGEITMLAGPNGEGKTVLLCCLAGGLEPTDGRVRVLGRPVEKAAEDVSHLPQASLGLPELTARENLAFYSRLRRAPSRDAEGLLSALGFDEPAGKPLRDCSGGTARKVELAVALNADVPVYLLDEPSVELDPSAVAALHDHLRSLRSEGRSVVMASHAPGDVGIADRVAFLSGGRVVAEGPPDRLLDSVPPVLRVRGTTPAVRRRIVPHLVGGYAFRRGDELRGFLRDGRGIDEVEAAVAGAAREPSPDVESASYADAFEYYTAADSR